MQDRYVGDIGDYIKYMLLRKIEEKGMTLSVNWYTYTDKKENEGKDTEYLLQPERYKAWDTILFETLKQIVGIERTISRIERANILNAVFYSKEIENDREKWHKNALEITKDSEVVFLDPNTGLETYTKREEAYVLKEELYDYYSRGQNVILYQHSRRDMNFKALIKHIFHYGKYVVNADHMMVFANDRRRFFFMFVHNNYFDAFKEICQSMPKTDTGLFQIDCD